MNDLAADTAPVATPLYAWHQARGARLVDFAGYWLPVQYGGGIIAEHHAVRSAAGLFDVSHMGQIFLSGDMLAARLEALVPADLLRLADGGMRYTLLTNEQGGAIDDLLVGRLADAFLLVVNASRKAEDLHHLRAHLPPAVRVDYWADRALLALQGPAAAGALAPLVPAATALRFMQIGRFRVPHGPLAGAELIISRTGYTGEDGFELSLPGALAPVLADQLCAMPGVLPCGLGARDTLRLEAGLCLYGHELDETTSPIEAGLVWSMPKRRRQEGGFIGAARILQEIQHGVVRQRVGLRLEGPVPARAGDEVFSADTPVGIITSGTLAPSLGRPVAMAYVLTAQAAIDTPLLIQSRGRQLLARVVPLPFRATNYYKGEQ